ncbi:hypothetical protein E4T42_03583 [Aureobasidium subglaciale]|nr:hypothetical protein E4T42_03583 [Aureobasidium subglaciale]
MAEAQDQAPQVELATAPEHQDVQEASEHTLTSPTTQLERPPSQEGSEEGEMADTEGAPTDGDAPPLPDEPLPDDAPPLPDEPLPAPVQEDDGWSAQLDPTTGCWYFLNSYTGLSQWENPRIPTNIPSQQYAPGTGPTSQAPGTEAVTAPSPPPREPYLGYNPKIHGDFDPNADYAKWHEEHQTEEWAASEAALAQRQQPTAAFEQAGTFNRFTGAFQAADKGAENHNDENKSKRQLNAFFDVDRAANAHEGRSLKAERANQKLSKKQVKAFNESRRAKKEQKRRDFLMS